MNSASNSTSLGFFLHKIPKGNEWFQKSKQTTLSS